MADELDNSIWDDDSWFNFNNDENEEEFKGKDEVEKMVVGETSKLAAGNGTNGDQVKKVQEAVALMPPPPPRPPVVEGKGKKRAAAAGTSGGGDGGVPAESGEHELHIWTERERRKKMKDMFTNLHALLTHLQPKADKATIVSEAAAYIKKLQETIQTLEQQKLDRLYQYTAAMSNPLLNNPFINYNPFSVITPPNLPPTQSREAVLAELGASSGNNNNNTAAIALPNNAANIAFPVVFKTWTSSNVILSVLGKDAYFNVCWVKKDGLLSAIGYVIEKYKMELITAQVTSDNNQTIFMIHARMDVASSDQFAEVEEIYKQAAAEIMFWVTS